MPKVTKTMEDLLKDVFHCKKVAIQVTKMMEMACAFQKTNLVLKDTKMMDVETFVFWNHNLVIKDLKMMVQE